MKTSYRLDSICTIIMGQAPKGEAYNTDGKGWPLIAGAGDFNNDRPAVKKYTVEASKVSQKGDIILGIRASIGAKVWSDGVYCLGRGVAALRPRQSDPGVDPRYLWHWLTFVSPQLASKGKGATFKQVNRNDIGELEIPLPSIQEQQRIVNLLDQIERLKAQRHSSLNLLDEYAHALYIEMFGDLDPSRLMPLGERLTFITSGGRGWARYYATHGARFIRSLDVRMNHISDANVAFVKPPDNAEAKRTEIQEGDVLLTITGSLIGRVSVVPAELSGAFVSQHVAILRPNRDEIDGGFLSFYLSLPEGGQRQISRLQYGQTKPGLNFEQIRSFSIPNISLVDQQFFMKNIRQANSIKKSHETQLHKLSELLVSLRDTSFRSAL